MCYKIEDGILHIDEYNSSKINSFKNVKGKSLTVKIPSGFKMNELDAEVVSADFKASDLDVRKLELETVSGKVSTTFASQPDKIEIESVSGNTDILLPSEGLGYNLSFSSVSGKVTEASTANKGNGPTIIDFESVSGNLTIDVTK